jgi:hypothetical protein
MFARILRSFLRMPVRNDLLDSGRLVLNEFDVSDLLLGRRWHQEEKSQNEEAEHK